jgi:hypothetical protein
MLDWFAGRQGLRDLAALAALTVGGGAVYCGIVAALFGREWLARFSGKLRR